MQEAASMALRLPALVVSPFRGQRVMRPAGPVAPTMDMRVGEQPSLMLTTLEHSQFTRFHIIFTNWTQKTIGIEDFF